MSVRADPRSSSLRAVIERASRPPAPAPGEERCDLCGERVDPDHRHMLDRERRRLLCACRACALLLDRPGAGGGTFRLLRERVRAVPGIDLDDALWLGLAIPVDMAFMFESTAAGRVVAFYPSPAGATESLLELDIWANLVERNPVLRTLEPDVEALLVNRTGGAHEAWLVPVDRPYRLVAILRTHWKGLAGGKEVWAHIEAFFDELRRSAAHVGRDGEEIA